MDNILWLFKLPFAMLRDLFKFLFFEYKHDENIRNLYIENAKKLKKIYQKFFTSKQLDNETRILLFEISEEAALYLHKEIVLHIEKVKSLIFEYIALNIKLDRYKETEERKKICDRMYKIDMEIYNHSEEYLQLYRKQIIQDGFLPKIQNCFKDINNKIKEVEKRVEHNVK